MLSLLHQHLQNDGRFSFLRMTRITAEPAADQYATSVASSAMEEADMAPPHLSLELSLVDAAGNRIEGLFTAKAIEGALAQLDCAANDWEVDLTDGSTSRPLPAYLRLNKTGFSLPIKDRLPGLQTHTPANAESKAPAVLWLYVQQELVLHSLAFLTVAGQRGQPDLVKFSSVSLIHPASKSLLRTSTTATVMGCAYVSASTRNLMSCALLACA